MVQLAEFLGYSASLLLMVMGIFVTMGFWGNKKESPPLSFFHIQNSDLDFGGIKALGQTVAERKISGWNQFAFGAPYIVSEVMYKNGQRYDYVAVPASFESELQGYLLLRGIKFNKVDNTEAIDAESILVSDFSLKALGGAEMENIIGPVAHSEYGGAAVQVLLRGNKDGAIDINSRLITFGDSVEAQRIFKTISGNQKGKFHSNSLETSVSLRLFRDKNVERINEVI